MRAARSARRCAAYHLHRGQPRAALERDCDGMQGAYLGPGFASDDIDERLQRGRRDVRDARRRRI